MGRYLRKVGTNHIMHYFEHLYMNGDLEEVEVRNTGNGLEVVRIVRRSLLSESKGLEDDTISLDFRVGRDDDELISEPVTPTTHNVTGLVTATIVSSNPPMPADVASALGLILPVEPEHDIIKVEKQEKQEKPDKQEKQDKKEPKRPLKREYHRRGKAAQ